MQKGITVYCASSDDIHPEYIQAAEHLGRLIAQTGLPLIDGAGRAGLMGAINNACLKAGGTAIGVIPQFMVDRNLHHTALTQLRIVDSMHTRKATMAQMATAAIALPGGIGTIEELSEIITWRKLGLFSGNIVILNTRRYYDPYIDMLRRATDQNFITPADPTYPTVADTPEQALALAIGAQQH